jgi:ABC-type polysaccharide/polyol phosphate export permease
MPNALIAACRDLYDGAKLAPLWWQLGIDQTISRFRRTILGPFWLSANLVAISIALTLVFGGLLGTNIRETFPMIMAGILCWTIIGQIMADAAPIFLQSAALMQVQKLPLSFHIFVHVQKAAINFTAQLITFLIIMLALRLLKAPPHWTLIPALLLIFTNCFFLSLLTALPSTRFRDIGFMVQFVVQIVFFLTPVFWLPSQMSPTRRVLVDYNPLAHELELIRQPLLGHAPTAANWIWSFGLMGILVVVAIIALALYRKRVVFWL